MRTLAAVLAALLALSARAEQDTPEGSKDHPLFNRMPRFFINGYTEKEFDGFAFPTGRTPDGELGTRTVEGRTFQIIYNKESGGAVTSALQVFRNFENALRQAKATIVAKEVAAGNSYSFITATVKRPGSEIWVEITAGDDSYQLDIVETQAMVQAIRADDMYAAIQKDGFIALDVRFDTGAATIRPESQPIVEQIAKLLQAHPSLKVGVEGHTDSTGTAAGNRKLSDDRARAVVTAVAAQGVAAARMAPRGFGQDVPVADNRTEEGRARNRRVEIVRK
jgi:outer membrane protein OmpA-like peptidoglycan-associated protein